MTRKDIEYTLRKSGFPEIAKRFYMKAVGKNRTWEMRAYSLGWKYLEKITATNRERIPYSDLTPEKWERYTGLKFHRMTR